MEKEKIFKITIDTSLEKLKFKIKLKNK